MTATETLKPNVKPAPPPPAPAPIIDRAKLLKEIDAAEAAVKSAQERVDAAQVTARAAQQALGVVVFARDQAASRAGHHT
jgi:hypothetical protein